MMNITTLDDEVFTQIQPQITTVTNTNAKFPYLKRPQESTKDSNGNIKICPPVSAEEHLAVQRETKARTTLLTALPDDHMGDFYHLDDAKEIWLAIKARALPPSWSQVTLHLLVLPVLTITMIPAVTTLLATLLLQLTLEIEKLLLSWKLRRWTGGIRLVWRMGHVSIRYKLRKRLEERLVQWTGGKQLEHKLVKKAMVISIQDEDARKKTDNSQALILVDTFINWQDHEDAHADEGALKIYGMIAGMESDPDSERKTTSEYALDGPEDWLGKPLYSWFTKEGDMHGVPPPMTGNYMPNHLMGMVNESKNNNFDSCESNFSVSTIESASETVVESEPNVVMSKVWNDAPIIEEVNSDNEYVVTPGKANVETYSTRPNLSTPVPTGRQNFSKPVTTGRRNLPTLVLTGKAVPAGRPNYPIPVTSGRTNNTVRPFPSVFKPNRPNTQSASPSKRPLHRASPPQTSFSYFRGDKVKTAVKTSTGCSWSSFRYVWKKSTKNNGGSNKNNRLHSKDPLGRPKPGNPHKLTEDLGIVDSGCSRSMTGNRHRLENFQEFKGGNVTFGGGEGKITGKGTIRTAKLDFENVLYVKELQHFNLFSVSQICDKKNRVLFTETECLVLTKDFKLPDETQVLLKVPRKHNLYSFNLEDLAPQGDLACLLAKATLDESTQWHRRLGHVNFKNMNKLVKDNLVRLDLEVILYFDGEKVHNFSLVLVINHSYWLISIGPGGLIHSSANQDIPADIFVTPGNMPISTGSGTIPAGVSVPT
ncbi:ribonuclease H-like domain-containing protein, partial [Tanacetum coccineum]